MLGAVVMWTMGTGRARALALAEPMTRELREAGVRSERLAEIARRTSNAVIITDAQGRITWTNEAFTRTSGYTLEEALGKVPGHLLQFEKTDPKAVETLRAAVRGGVGCRVEIVNRGKTGREYVLDIEINPLHDAAGTLTGFMAVESDITEQIAAKEAIATSEARFRTLVEGTDIIVYEFDPAANRFTYVSPQAATMGYPQAAWLVPGFWEEHVYEEDRDRAVAFYKAEAASGRAHRFQYRMHNADGSIVWIDETASVEMKDGKPSLIRGVLMNITEQVESKLQLVCSEAMLRETGQTAGVGGWESNVTTGKVLWTDQTRIIHEVPLDYEPSVNKCIEFYAPAARPVIAKAIERCMETGEGWDLELPFITAKGRSIWTRSVGRVAVENGRIVRLLGAFQDITAQVEAGNKLKEATERFELAVAGTADGVWDWNIATGAVYYASRFKELLGYSSDATDFPAVFESFFSRLHPDDLGPTQAAISRAIETDTPYEAEYRLKTRDGEWRWFRARGAIQRDPSGRAVRMAGAISDITQSRASEEQLKIATALLEEAQSVARMGNWSFDLATGKVHWSKQVFAFFGRCETDGPPDYAGVQSGYHPDDSRTHDDAVRACTTEGKPYSLELRTSGLRSTKTRHVRAEGRARFDASGNVVGLYGTVTDVTAEVDSREALQQARAQAEAASRAKSEFLANMSHEIRTPLTAILGYADLLREDVDAALAPARRIETIDTIRNAGAHLLTVINDILDISKIEADKMTVERVATPLTTILNEVVSLIRPRAAGKGVTLTAALASPVPDSILSDPTRLRQILMNLAGNAAKFTEAGTVTVTARTESTGDRSWLIIDVDDTGHGMTQEQAGRLFESFSQADSAVTRKHGGTGLGLTICRRLASLMDGGVTLARTEPGKGSCFRVELPLEAAPGAVMVERLDAMVAEANTASPSRAVLLTGRILLAEDGIDNQKLIAFHLRKAGATVDIADNGRIALEMIDRSEADTNHYDLLLTDMQMPEMDGYTLARTLRDRGSRLAIVALTAHAMAEDRQKCIDSGCDDHATKPIEKAKLLTTCADWIGKASKIQVARRAA